MAARAFLIGCSEYDDPDIASLKFPGEDVGRVATVARDACGLGEDEVVVLSAGHRAPSRNNIIRAVARPRGQAGRPGVDLLLLFFSGHGFHSPRDGKEYLVPSDAVYNDLEGTSLSFPDLVGHLQDWGARTIVLFLDACRATVEGGRSAGRDWQRLEVGSLEARPGMAIFSSCSPGQRSYESESLRSGIFTHGLCEALGDAGRCATIYELDRYLVARIPALSRQQGKPEQVPYTRVEPLDIQRTVIVSPRRADAWRSSGLIGTEIRRAPRFEAVGAIAARPPICAIDLGTSYSAISFAKGETSVLIPSHHRRHLVPSVVYFDENLDYIVGWDAVERARYDPENAVFHVKRHLGSPTIYNLHGRSLTPEFVASCILRSLARNAQDFLGITIQKFLVAIPANFSIAQGNAMARACQLAGLEVLRMIAEPSVASLLLDDKILPASSADQIYIVAVVNLGGGTFDVSLINTAVNAGVKEVLAVAGDMQLGGVDYDEAIYRYAVEAFRGRIGDGSYEFSAVDHLQIRNEAERAKIALGSKDETTLILRDVEAGPGGFQNLEVTLSRDQFRALTVELNARVESCIRRAVEIVPYDDKRKVSMVLLAGQGSKIFTVAEVIDKVFGAVPVIRGFQETAVAQGIARQAGILGGEVRDNLLLDAIPNSIAIRCASSEAWRPGRATKRGSNVRIVVSADPSENREIHPIVEFSTTIPHHARCVIVPAKEEMADLALEFVEVGNLDQGVVGLGSISIRIPAQIGYAMFNVNIDANRTIIITVRDDDRKELRIFQVNNSMIGSRYPWYDDSFYMSEEDLKALNRPQFFPPYEYKGAPLVVM